MEGRRGTFCCRLSGGFHTKSQSTHLGCRHSRAHGFPLASAEYTNTDKGTFASACLWRHASVQKLARTRLLVFYPAGIGRVVV